MLELCRFFLSNLPAALHWSEPSSSLTKIIGRFPSHLPACGLESRMSGWWLTSEMLFIGVEQTEKLRG